ncbi:hypothetical protein DL98DRAFT_573776 [Cadophora sp. DSE1049]|nr:hypothetical protein DL98DRAFT_573776 [Cadophora sp. DSE1049]
MSNSSPLRILILPGDGAGRELASVARRVLDKIQTIRPRINLDIQERDFGGSALAKGSEALSDATLQHCKNSDAVLLCGCGDSRYGLQPEQALLKLRSALGVFVNLRAVSFPSEQLVSCSAYKSNVIDRVDITFVRELTSGVYYGLRQEASLENEQTAFDTTEYSRAQIERTARWAGDYARRFSPPKVVHSVDKANVMATSKLWRSTVAEVFEKEYPEISLDHFLVDFAAMRLSFAPKELNGIVLTENLFGDILSDQAGAILGSQDVLPSAGFSTAFGNKKRGQPALFEPVNLKTSAVGGKGSVNPLGVIQSVGLMLAGSLDLVAEAKALESAIRKTLDPTEALGSNICTVDLGGRATTSEFMDVLLENFEFALEAAHSTELSQAASLFQQPLSAINTMAGRRSMGIAEKILTHATIGLEKPEVKPGDMICVSVDYIVTSELLWGGMEKTYDQIKRPRVYRNDRIWIALDHTIDPRTKHRPFQQSLIARSERFRKEAKLIDFVSANVSIMHTDFTRERAQPGHLVVGSDSHTCSAGSMGSLAIGFGAADVVMPMVTGETWFRVPEVCNIHFIGKLPPGLGGKEVILHILGKLKRNTIALHRAVEYTGPGLKELSMDARFAIANMTTEFGGIGACFEADAVTSSWISKRSDEQHRNRGMFFRADPDAYPNPDDVVPLNEKEGMSLHGCFIGACTTTEEDLVLGALVLEAGFKHGLSPVKHGQRRVTPGSLKIVRKLRENGFLEIYERAGFGIGAPGCSYCVGINDVDVAGEGEVWLSSQNRNFRNRMGKGSFAYITSAATVAASSFTMQATDPSKLLADIDMAKYKKIVKAWTTEVMLDPDIVEPNPKLLQVGEHSSPIVEAVRSEGTSEPSSSKGVVKSKIQRFGKNVDTDAVIPAQFMPGVDNADLGSHCFQYTRPGFREKAQRGSRVIVAEEGFGSGSSREDAVRALQGAHIEIVIAKSFAFIYERNQTNMGLYNIVMKDPEFYEFAVEDAEITIDKDKKIVRVEGTEKVFPYSISRLEETLLDAGGVVPLYKKYEKAIFRHLVALKSDNKRPRKELGSDGSTSSCLKSSAGLDW